MRHLIIQVPRGCGQTVLHIAKSHNAANVAQFQAKGSDEPIDLAIVHVSNRQIEKLLAQLQDLPSLHISLLPTGVMALQPPAKEAPQQVTNVEERSPIEIFLSGLQSVGSWRGFLGYAAVAGFVVWIGLYTNTSYLLVAAMLIAPFAGPAMNTAIATARGDRILLGRSLLRYFATLAVTIATTYLLSLILPHEIPTSLMIDSSQVSAVAVLIPLTAGAAGALNLVQSDRSSLVSGAVAGMLVAASLAPPAGIVGMATALGRWDLVINGLFLLLLQLGGINLSASLLFRIYGLSTQGTRYQRGQKWVTRSALAITVIALIGLLTWQFSNSPNLERSSRAQRANAEVQNAAGIAFDMVVGGSDRAEEENVQEAVDRFFTIYIFVLLGLALPWQQWLELGWKGLLLAVAVLLLRRPPAFLLLRPLLGQLKSWQDTLFLAWFSPIGAAAIFYAMLALRKTGLESAWVIGSLIICASIIAHGFTAVPLAKAYAKMQRKRQLLMIW